MNETISMLKLTLIAALSVVLAYFNALLISIAVLVIVMMIDYISGMVSAKKTGEPSRRDGLSAKILLQNGAAQARKSRPTTAWVTTSATPLLRAGLPHKNLK